jgi:hypothetical protein
VAIATDVSIRKGGNIRLVMLRPSKRARLRNCFDAVVFLILCFGARSMTRADNVAQKDELYLMRNSPFGFGQDYSAYFSLNGVGRP